MISRTEGNGSARDPRESSDQELVVAFQEGDRTAFSEIYRRYRPMAERICLRFVANAEDAKELSQETMLRALQHLEDFNGRYALRAWVARIATNVCLDAIRTRDRRPVKAEGLNGDLPELPNGNGAEEDPGELIAREAERREVHEHLARLPERHRVALVLREFEGLSHEEIAEMLGTSAPRVKALLFRARRQFEKAWGDGNGRKRLGLLLPPTIVPWRLQQLFQRIFPSVETAAVPAAVSPAAATLTERATAGLTALFVAGAGAIGITTVLPSKRQERPPPVISAPPALAPHPEDGVATLAMDARGGPKRDRRDRRPEASPSPSPTAAPTPSPSPSPSPSGPPEPAGFEFSFTSPEGSEESCGCADRPYVGSQSINGSPAGLRSFQTRVQGAAIHDAEGDPAWRVEVFQDGSDSSHNLSFYVSTPQGAHTYLGSGTLVAEERTDWGGWVYTYTGSYAWQDGPGQHQGLPAEGTYAVELTFSFETSRLIKAVISLG